MVVHTSDAGAMSRMGVRSADCPAVLLHDQQNMTKYRPLVGHQLTSSKIWLFVRSVLDGKLQVRIIRQHDVVSNNSQFYNLMFVSYRFKIHCVH